MKRHFDELDVGRCIANYLIVLLHAGGLAVQYGRPGSAETAVGDFVTQRGCNVALSALFVISGYLLFSGYRLADWPRKIVSRLRRLMLPYIAWNAAFVAFYLSVADLVPRIASRVTQFGLDSVGGVVDKIIGPCTVPIDVPLWYVRFVFVIAVVSPVLWPLLRQWAGRFAFLGLVTAYYAVTAFGDCEGWVLNGYRTLLLLLALGARAWRSLPRMARRRLPDAASAVHRSGARDDVVGLVRLAEAEEPGNQPEAILGVMKGRWRATASICSHPVAESQGCVL